MVDTEIWLRLMSISSLYGDDMVRTHWLAKQSHIDAVVLQQTGLTLRQAPNGFLSFPRKSIGKLTLLVGANPTIILIPADSEFYPPQLLATTDYPAHCLLKENCTRCIHFSLP